MIMDRITLPDKGLQFLADFAAPSVLTGRFVASIVHAEAETVRSAFTAPGEMLVENVEGLYAPKTYTGYDLDELQERDDRTIVKLSKEARDGQGVV